MGMWSAWRAGGWVDRVAGAASLGLGSTPDVLVGLGVVMGALRWGVGPVHENVWLGAGALALVGFPAVFRHTRSSMAGALRQPAVGHLRACGVSEARIVLRYAARAAANPIVNLLGLAVAGLTSSSLVIEAVMGWPGMGTLLLEAILARDAHVVLAAVMVSGGMLTLGNLAADVLLWAVDPRIRRGGR